MQHDHAVHRWSVSFILSAHSSQWWFYSSSWVRTVLSLNMVKPSYERASSPLFCLQWCPVMEYCFSLTFNISLAHWRHWIRSDLFYLWVILIDLTETAPILKETKSVPFFLLQFQLARTVTGLLAKMKLKICCTSDQAYIYAKDSSRERWTTRLIWRC